MKFIKRSLFIVCIFLLAACTPAGEETVDTKELIPGIPVKNTVTMVDLGSDSCVPCKLMAPILKELQGEYKGRAAVIYIDVLKKENRSKADAFNIMTIPTQVFYDKNGVEVSRHVGFLDKKGITDKLDELLAH